MVDPESRRDGQASDPDPASESAGAPPGAVLARRRRLFLGSLGAALAGMAVVVGVLGLPGVPPILAFGAGMITTAAAFAVVYAGLFGGAGRQPDG